MSAFNPVVGDLLEVNVERSPNKVAVLDPEENISLHWSDWKVQIMRLANFLLTHGIEPRDRIGAVLRDAIDLPTALFATAKLGGIFVPVNYRLSAEELRYVLDDCTARILIFDEEDREVVERIRDRLKHVEMYIYTGKGDLPFAKRLASIIEKGEEGEVERAVSEADIAMIMYTSGTTGRPKGVVHTHRGVIAATEGWTHPARITPLDRSLALGPLYHIGPLLSNFMPTLYMGGTNVIQKQFDPAKTLKWIKDLKLTLIWATPTHLNMICSVENVKEFDMKNLRAIQYSGAPLQTGLFYKIRDIFGKIDLINAYGMTELDSVSATYPQEHDEHLRSVGRALPRTFVRVIDPNKGDPEARVKAGEVGEIIVRAPCVMKEYWGLPGKTGEAKKGEWYFTGDLGRMDEEGYLYFVEREDDMIISGGENIYPLEVENVLSRHKKVRSVAIVGSPDEKWGEIVTAFVVKADATLTEQELEAYCMQSDDLSKYKRPRKYVFVKELPTTSSGKVDKKVLRGQMKSNVS